MNNERFFDIIVGILNKSEKNVNYAGFIVDVKQPYLSQYHRIHPELPEYYPIYKTRYCSGRFYLLSKQSIIYLLKQRSKIEKEYLEDYSIGLNLSDELKENMFNIKINNYFIDME